MSGYLLDTNIVVHSAAWEAQLTSAVRGAIEEGPVWLSVISYWEIMVKSMKGRIQMGAPGSWWQEALERLNAQALSLRGEHVAALCSLPALHQDPFDRALIAQAIAEDLTFLTTDRTVMEYASAGLRVIH